MQKYLDWRYQNQRHFRRREEENINWTVTAHQPLHNIFGWTHNRPRFHNFPQPHKISEQIGKTRKNRYFYNPSAFIINLHGIRPHNVDGGRTYHIRRPGPEIDGVFQQNRFPRAHPHKSNRSLHEVDEQGGADAEENIKEDWFYRWEYQVVIRPSCLEIGYQFLQLQIGDPRCTSTLSQYLDCHSR